MTTTPDFRAELQRLVDLYYALGGNWSPHGYTDTWNDALANARTALATLPPEPPTDEELLALQEKLWGKYKTIPYQGEEFMYGDAFESALSDYRAALERWGQR